MKVATNPMILQVLKFIEIFENDRLPKRLTSYYYGTLRLDQGYCYWHHYHRMLFVRQNVDTVD